MLLTSTMTFLKFPGLMSKDPGISVVLKSPLIEVEEVTATGSDTD